MTQQSFVLFGNQSILAQCGEKIRDAGHQITCVVTDSTDIAGWARGHGIKVTGSTGDLAQELQSQPIDWILSLAYLSVIPADVLKLATKGAVNFHDGLLPEYAGLNTPVWARINQAADHGITWHFMEAGVDKGDIIAQHRFPIEASDTAFTLNTKCFETAVESFSDVLAKLIDGDVPRVPQSFENRKLFGRYDRPDNFGLLDFSQTAEQVIALVRGLDHQAYWNPVTTAKVLIGGQVYGVRHAEIVNQSGQPAEILSVTNETIVVACTTGAVELRGIVGSDGKDLNPTAIVKQGDLLDQKTEVDLDHLAQQAAKSDAFWRAELGQLSGAKFSLCDTSAGSTQHLTLTLESSADLRAVTAFVATAQQEGGSATLAIAEDAAGPMGLIAPWKPVRIHSDMSSWGDFETALSQKLERIGSTFGFAQDLLSRAPELNALETPDIGISTSGNMVPGTAVTICENSHTLIYDQQRMSTAAAEILAARINHVAEQLASLDRSASLDALNIMPAQEMDLLLAGWNDTARAYDASVLLHQPFEAIAAKTPDKTALVFEGLQLSYGALNTQADAIAKRLNASGIGRGDVVGLFVQRSPEMIAAALGILKSGAAYLSLDPAYPAERTEYCVQDSQAKAVITHSAVLDKTPKNARNLLIIDRPEQDPSGLPVTGDTAQPTDLAYMIYTSGSTGKPKGVMVEHRNVANFFAGMDDRIEHDGAGVWLAVTSLSFDISVLEVFWTLGRGFKLVLTGDEGRTALSNGPLPSQVAGMDFSLYYWGNDDGVGRDKYKTLLEGAKFADKNGFCGVWTPERHFHAFGGPYPNPSVTGAAVAAVTENLSVRAGSCVAPLHHSARIAEEWSVIDNLTNGRAGLAIASGWQPDDFILRPENTPPHNKPAMFKSIEELRALWAGEPVAFAKADGTTHAVVTQPRPVSNSLPIWVTTAGNPETWRQAGEIGANVLTHLLGQSVAEVGEKINIYHQALRDNGHNPKDFNVTLMLHTFLHADRDQAREIAREPMKDYLRSAAGLIKQYAWAFPAFKRPEGVDHAFQLDLGMLDEEELEAILDFAFLRYFDESGLFGTVSDAMQRVEEVMKIGVTEIACLIDYGIDADQVLHGLHPVAEVVRRCNEGAELQDDDFSVAAQIMRHGVTHMQCTPSMARMFLLNDETRQALGEMSHILLGGEALPGALVEEINSVSDAQITNMYGPTETTIWSTTAAANAGAGTVSIGTPIANTQVYVLDENRKILPIGKPGELWIGGDGVARGYWQRDDLTAERFLADPFSQQENARMYQTGDLVQRRSDGSIDYIGRADFQVKLRGYRIELGEIEAALDSHRDVTQSAVVVSQESDVDARLIGYFTAINGIQESTLKAFLADRLPTHMVPANLVQLDQMPLTPNKKIDRKALSTQRRAQPVASVATSKQDTGANAQTQIATIWRHVLGNVQFSGNDNFFDIGGHSLLAVQAHREIREKLSVPKLSITDIFRFPVLSDLSQRVDALRSGDTATPTPAQPDAPVAAPSADAGKSAIRNSAIERRRAMRARRAK